MLEYKLIRSARKTISAQVLRDGSVLVRAPRFCPIALIERFLEQKETVLERYRREMLSLPPVPRITKKELNSLKQEAGKVILHRVEQISKSIGVTYDGASITSARQRFGSCNSKNHLCFSAFLVLADPEEIDYVIVHELCHTLEHNHSPRFYAWVSRFMPDWKTREKKLKRIVIPEIVE